MKQIKLSFTEDYVGHWSWWEGARELMQNAIDTQDFDIDFEWGNTGDLTIISRGGSIPTSALLLGATTKRDDSSTIGKFGEGMKLGFLVLLREGAEIAMENGKDLWVPKIIHDDTFGANVLSVNVCEGVLDANNPDTVKIKIQGIPRHALEEIADNYAPMTEREVYLENSRGKAYSKIWNRDDENQNETEDGEYEGGACNLFVNGLFVTRVEGNFRFDYDFKPDAFTLDRDRNSASTFEVKYEANKLLSESDDIDLLARLALEQYDDLALFSERRVKGSGDYWSAGRPGSEQEELSATAVSMFSNKYGSDAYPIDETWSDGKKRVVTQMAIGKGYVPVTVKPAIYRMVQKNFDVDKEVEKVLTFKPLPFLEGFLERHSRRLVAKPRRELEKTIQMLRIAEGKE